MQATFGLALVWFVANYSGLRRPWLLGAYSGIYLLHIVIHFSQPLGISFRETPELRGHRLPWGEEIVLPSGAAGRWAVFGDLLALGCVAFCVGACAQLWRAGKRRKAGGLAVALSPLVLIAIPYGLLVDKGVITAPYIFTFAFLGLVIATSIELVGQVAQTSKLTQSVRENEQRWSSFLEHVPLLVVGVDADARINYINPFVEEITGLPRDQLLGRHLKDIEPSEAGSDYFERFSRRAAGETDRLERTRTEVAGKRGKHVVEWSTAVIRGVGGAVSQVVGVGADVTQQTEAEEARDRALKKIEELSARLEEENIYLKNELAADGDFSQVVGESNAIRYVLHMVKNVATTDATALILGETGVGKELIARSIHELSSRSKKPFVRVNCAALPAPLAEAELFGHEKGAFTGADLLRRGRFELAHGGTIFLDEIGDLPLEVQAKLLRVLQDGEFERLGSSETRRVDVRLIAATNRNLDEQVAAERFRIDLFYRINVYPITVPPLRDRAEDIPLLVQHFVNQLSNKHGKRFEEIQAQAMRDLSDYDWPGNVRELINIVERAVITSPGPVLKLPGPLGVTATEVSSAQEAATDYVALEEMERRYIGEVLYHTEWKIGGPEGAARILGMNDSTLRSRMKKLGIKRSAAQTDRLKTPGESKGTEYSA